jgi:predicted TPR repeat methyltransferase
MAVKSIYEIATQKINRGDLEGAKKIFKKLLASDKNDLRALEGISYIFLVSEDYQNTLIYVDQLIAKLPPNAILQFRKTIAHLRLLQLDEAIKSFEYSTKLDPSHPDIQPIQFEIMQMMQDQNNDHLKYLSARFDINAEGYDQGRASVAYDAPKLLYKSLTKYSKDHLGRVLDIGCGTGLSGAFLREKADYLIGVDISEKMLAEAQSKNIYDELVNKDIVHYLAEQEPHSVDAIMAASVVIYFGDLNKLITTIKSILVPKGIFVFDVLTQKFGKWSTASPNGRIFRHNPDYIKSEITAAGLKCYYFHTSTFKYVDAQHTNPGAVFTIIKDQA